MDSFDASLIRFFTTPRDFQWDVRASFSAAARELGATEDTVRARFQRLREQGIIEGWHVMVNPDLMGRHLLRVEAPVPDGAAKDRLVEQVGLLEGAHLLFDYHRGGVAVVFYCRPGDEERLTRLVGSMGDVEARAVRVPSRPAAAEADAKTWRTIQALRAAPRAPLQDLAADLGVSTKTVHRRLARLQQDRAVILSVHADFSRMAGAIVVEVRVGLSEQADRQAWRDRIHAWPGLMFSNVEGPAAVASRLVESPMEATQLRRALEDAPDTDWAAVDVIQQRLVLDDWLDGEVGRRAGDR